MVIDRTVWPRSGAIAVYAKGRALEIVAATPPGYDRPWARSTASVPPVVPQTPRDTTPRAEDLAPDD